MYEVGANSGSAALHKAWERLRLEVVKKSSSETLFRTCRRSFRYRSEEKEYNEFMLYAIGRNIMKYYCFRYQKIKKYERKTEQKTA